MNKIFAELFEHLSARQQDVIRSHCREITAKKGETILHQQEKSFDLYFVISGSVKVSLISEDGREIVLDVLQKGDFFGELSLIDRRARSAMVTAIDNVRMLVLQRDTFFGILKDNSDISVSLLSVMANRLRKADETIETLTFLDVAGRVSKILIDLAKVSGERMKDGHIKIKCPTHQSIARQIGASREAVTKSLKTLASKGLITAKGKEIIISPRQFEIL